MYIVKNTNIGKNNIFKLKNKSSFKNFIIVSDKTIKITPMKKIIILDLLYNLFSLVNKIRNMHVKIRVGIYKGTTNLL